MRLNPHTCAKTLTCTFPTVPEGQAAYDSRQKSWLGRSCPVHPVIPLSVCLSASLHLWSDTVELTPRSPPLDSEADSCITESGLCGWIMTAEAESSTAVCAGLEWAERVTPGWRHCGQLILSLVKKPACSCCSEWKMRVFANWTYLYARGIWPG